MEVRPDMMREGDALLVVDVQNDFCPGGALPIPEGHRVVPVLNTWLAAAHEKGMPVHASRDWHPEEHPSFQTRGGPWPRHCIQDLLDAGGLGDVKIVASSGLDEHVIAKLVGSGAPIDGFGVGTGMGVSRDAPSLDLAYKLTEYDGKGRIKLSADKPILPGRKQVFRVDAGDAYDHDVIGCADEARPGRPLLETVMRGGRRAPDQAVPLDVIRRYALAERERLPARVRSLGAAEPPYPVRISDALRKAAETYARRLSGPRA